MSKIRLADSPAEAVRGQDHVVLLAPRQVLVSRAWAKVLKGRWTAVIPRMLEGAEPGPLGKVVVTHLAAGSPRRFALGVLPDSVSRHASRSRNHAIHECCKNEISRGRVGVVLVLDDAEDWVAAANAVGRAAPLYSNTRRKREQPTITVAAVDRSGRPLAPPAHASATVEAARWAAAMVDRPTSELTTAGFVDEARELLAGLKSVKSRVLVGDELLTAGLGGIHAVGRAAVVPPRLLVLEHAPKSASRTLALVGKGIVFDTGGLALKPRDAMLGMKGDMGGGAAVVGAFRVLVKGGYPDRLLCLVPLAENAIGPAAYRQDEILKLHSGKTVEINNTDAEGRILLADACSYAARVLGADVIVDAATLTGAQLVATGKRHAAVVSNREGLEQLAVAAGRLSGDLAHPLPFAPEFFQREFKSAVADMTNSVKDRANAQSSCAAQFVWSHVDDTQVAWLHVDLAGPAFPADRGSGYGVALLAEVARSLDESDLE